MSAHTFNDVISSFYSTFTQEQNVCGQLLQTFQEYLPELHEDPVSFQRVSQALQDNLIGNSLRSPNN